MLSALLALIVGGGYPEEVGIARAATCDPRPPVLVRVTPAGTGKLQASISAGTGTLRQIKVQEGSRATVTLSGGSLARTGETSTLAPGTISTVLHFSPEGPGQSAVVSIVVWDDCGPWTTFVGGGQAAFASQPPAIASPTTSATAVPSRTPASTPLATTTPTPMATPSSTPSPTLTAPPSGTPSPSPSPVSSRPPWQGVPTLPLDYTLDVETWWGEHPFNPESLNYAPGIASPDHQVNVLTQHSGNIQAAIDSLPPEGGTLFFPAATYEGAFRLVGKSHVHLVGQPGAVIRSASDHKILGCASAEEYGTFALLVHMRDPVALACATTNRIRDVYIKNLTFDGAGVALQGLQLSAAQDIVFDDVTLQNYVNPGNHHRGLVSGNASLENIWFRATRFVGRERFALYLDGLHGGGVINSVIENGFNAGALLFLTNDDFSRDHDRSGTVEPREERMAKYVVVYGNTFHGNPYDLVRATGRDLLVKNNTATGTVATLATFHAKSSYVDANLQYQYLGNRVVGNRLRQVQQIVEIEAPPACPFVLSCARIGAYQVRDNVVTFATGFRQAVKEVSNSFGTIEGPNVTSGNCIGSAACP